MRGGRPSIEAGPRKGGPTPTSAGAPETSSSTINLRNTGPRKLTARVGRWGRARARRLVRAKAATLVYTLACASNLDGDVDKRPQVWGAARGGQEGRIGGRDEGRKEGVQRVKAATKVG